MEKSDKDEILLAIGKLGDKIDVMQKDVSNLQKDVSNLKKDVSNLQEETRRISKSVAVIELEHGEKLDLLFDIFDMHQEKLRSNERRIQLCERHLSRHDDEFYYLKAVQGL